MRVSDYTDTTRNCPGVRVSSLLYVVFAIAFAEKYDAAANNNGWSTSIMSPGVTVGVTRSSLS